MHNSIEVKDLPDKLLFYQDVAGRKEPLSGTISSSKKDKIVKKHLKPRALKVTRLQATPFIKQDEEVSKKKKKALSRSDFLYVNKQVRLLKADKRKNKEQPKNEKQYTDIWANTSKSEPKSGFEFLPKPVELNVPTTLKAFPKAKLYQSAVDPGHPGSSYQPSAKDLQMLLNQASNKSKKKKINLNLSAKLKKKSTPLKKKMKKSKSSVPKGVEKKEIDDSQIVEGNAEDPNNPSSEVGVRYVPLPTPRVTHKERLKRKRCLLAKKRMLLARKKKRRFDPTVIKKKLEEVEQKILKRKLRLARRLESKFQKQLLPQRLSRHKFKPKNPEVLAPSELPSSLRALRPTGNLFKDRFESLLKRNIIEPRVRVGKRNKRSEIAVFKPSYHGF